MHVSGIGSLPHHNIDAAIEYSLRHTLPFLPQTPIRNAWEYALPQALEGLPGLRLEAEGAVSLDAAVWTGRASYLDERLAKSFAHAVDEDAFAEFELSSSTSSCWQPFLWELTERGFRSAKIQLMGPLTSQWVLQFTSPPGDRDFAAALSARVGSQIFRLFLARALGMTRRLRRLGIEPVLFIDEPALYVLSLGNPRHVLGIEELRLAIRTLKKEGVRIGIHCCSDTHWETVLGLGLDWLSIDVALSLPSVLGAKAAVKRFLKEGGAFAFGVVPTAPGVRLGELGAEILADSLRTRLTEALGDTSWEHRTILTPACGLALHTPADAELALALLERAQSMLDPSIAAP